MLRRLTVLVTAGFTLAACTSGEGGPVNPSAPQASSASPPPVTALATYDGPFLRFVHPAAWRARYFRFASSYSTSLVDLSNQRLHNPCVVHRSKGRISDTCHGPLRTLQPGGVLVEWSAVGMGPAKLSGARRMNVGGLPAEETVTRPGDCATIGADETIKVTIGHLRSGSYWDACLRGPGLADEGTAFQAMLRSVHFTDPGLPVAAGPRAAACTSTDLRIRLNETVGAAGTVTYWFTAENIRRGTCAVDGYFRYAVFNRRGELLSARDAWQTRGPEGQREQTGSILLAPGGRVSTLTTIGDHPITGHFCPQVGSWRLTAPNTTTPVRVAVPAKAASLFCNGRSGPIAVYPTEAGVRSVF